MFPPFSLQADFLLLSFFILVLINISIDKMMRHLDATEVAQVVQLLQDSTSTWAQSGEHAGDSRRQGVAEGLWKVLTPQQDQHLLLREERGGKG